MINSERQLQEEQCELSADLARQLPVPTVERRYPGVRERGQL